MLGWVVRRPYRSLGGMRLRAGSLQFCAARGTQLAWAASSRAGLVARGKEKGARRAGCTRVGAEGLQLACSVAGGLEIWAPCWRSVVECVAPRLVGPLDGTAWRGPVVK